MGSQQPHTRVLHHAGKIHYTQEIWPVLEGAPAHSLGSLMEHMYLHQTHR